MATFTLEELQNKHKGQTPKAVLSFEELQARNQPPQAVQDDRNVLEKASDVTADFSEGFVKRGLSTLQNIGKGALNALTLGQAKEQVAKTGFPEESFELENTAQKVGGFASDVAQFAVPGTAASKATKGLGFLTRTGVQVLSDVGVQASQSGDIGKDELDVALVSAALPVIGKTASSVGGLLKNSKNASRIIDSLIKPLSKDVAYGKNPGAAISQEGITANSLEELTEKITTVKNQRMADLTKTLSESNAVFDVSTAFSPIDNAMSTAAKQNNQAAVNRLNDLKEALTKNLALVDDEGGAVIKAIDDRNLVGLSAKEVVDLKREVGDLTSYTGNPSDDKIVNKALQGVYSNLKKTVDDSVPGAKQISERVADLISAENAAKHRDVVAQRLNLISFGEKTVGVTSGAAAALAAGSIGPGVIVGLGAAGLTKILKTTRAKTQIAKWLASAPEAEKQAVFNAAPWVRSVIINSFAGE